MRRYLFPFILVASVLFFWPDRNPIVITRIARVIVCSFILAPCIIAILLFIKPEISISELWQILKSKVTIKSLKSLLRFIVNAVNEIKPITWISFFIVWLGITTTYNILFGFLSFNVASTEMLYFLSLTLMFYLVQRLNIESKIIIKTITYIVIFQAALGIFQYTTGIYFPFENVIGKRVAVGFLDHTSNFGAFLAIGLPFVFCFAPKAFHWLLGLFVLFAIVLSGSLTGLIASVFGVYIFYRSRKLAIAGLILITVFFFFYKTQVLDQHASSVVTRINMWTESLKITAYKPLTGFGLGNYHIIMPQYMQQKKIPQIGNNELWDNPSNDYVRAVFEAGFPALIFIAGFIYVTIRRYNRFINRETLHSRVSDNDIKLYFSSFVTILILCMGYSLFLNPTNIIWAVIVIALLNSKLNRREVEC